MRFKSKLALDKALNKTLATINDKLKAYPTVIWSGHGYHIYLPVKAFVLEQESQFSKFEQPSRRFIQFAEQYLSNRKSDPCHSWTMSFKNCMLRVPGSYNSKSDNEKEEVKIIQRWDGNRPSIKPLLFDFYLYLQDLKLKKIQQHYHPPKEYCRYKSETDETCETHVMSKSNDISKRFEREQNNAHEENTNKNDVSFANNASHPSHMSQREELRK